MRPLPFVGDDLFLISEIYVGKDFMGLKKTFTTWCEVEFGDSGRNGLYRVRGVLLTDNFHGVLLFHVDKKPVMVKLSHCLLSVMYPKSASFLGDVEFVEVQGS